MKYLARFLLAVLCVVPFGAQGSNVPTTRGNNLTAYNGASGSTNNNNWNALMNVPDHLSQAAAEGHEDGRNDPVRSSGG